MVGFPEKGFLPKTVARYSFTDAKPAQICPDTGLSAAEYRKGNHYPTDCARYCNHLTFRTGNPLADIFMQIYLKEI